MLKYEDLHEYQHKIVQTIIEEKTHLFAVDMGLGKTASTLTAISALLDSFAIERVVVFAPLRVANSSGSKKPLVGSTYSICECPYARAMSDNGSRRYRIRTLNHAQNRAPMQVSLRSFFDIACK